MKNKKRSGEKTNATPNVVAVESPEGEVEGFLSRKDWRTNEQNWKYFEGW